MKLDGPSETKWPILYRIVAIPLDGPPMRYEAFLMFPHGFPEGLPTT